MASPSSQVPGTGERQTKGERTRARLKRAARQVLGTRGYRAARVTDITQGAGLSQGAFYPYFPNKREIALEVMGELLDEGRAALLSAPRRDDPFDQILAPTRAYVDFLFAHAPWCARSCRPRTRTRSSPGSGRNPPGRGSPAQRPSSIAAAGARPWTNRPFCWWPTP
jgi:AcrR family transcriptional regulator